MFAIMRKIIFLFFFYFVIYPANAHVEHYQNLNKLVFNLYRNNNFIGTHTYTFTRKNESLTVLSKIEFAIKKLGIVFYNYRAEGTEVYEEGKLIIFSSKTNQNKKEKFVDMSIKNNKYLINGSSYKGYVPLDYVIGTWWNHAIVSAEAQISAVSGRIIKQKVEFLGKETIQIGNQSIESLHFNFTSSDKKLDKDKKLNTHIWYDSKTLNWIKAKFKKNGTWEYRLKSIE